MPIGSAGNTDNTSLDGAVCVLAQFASTARVTFDRGQARRLLHETERAIPGDGSAAWGCRLVEVG